MANQQLPLLYTSVLLNFYAINAQNTTITLNTTTASTLIDNAEPLNTFWDKENIIVIFGAAVVTLAFFLCLVLTFLYGLWVRRNGQKSQANHGKKSNVGRHSASNRADREIQIARAPQSKKRRRKRNKKQQEQREKFDKAQMRQLERMMSEELHRKYTNFSNPHHISAYNALQFSPPINHAGDKWKQLDHVNSNHRLMQLMHQQMMVNQSAMAMDYFLGQQHPQAQGQQQHNWHNDNYDYGAQQHLGGGPHGKGPSYDFKDDQSGKYSHSGQYSGHYSQHSGNYGQQHLGGIGAKLPNKIKVQSYSAEHSEDHSHHSGKYSPSPHNLGQYSGKHSPHIAKYSPQVGANFSPQIGANFSPQIGAKYGSQNRANAPKYSPQIGAKFNPQNRANGPKYSPQIGAKFNPQNRANGANKYSPYNGAIHRNNKQDAHLGEDIDDLDEDVIAGSGSLPESVASGLSEGPKNDAFKFQVPKKKKAFALAENNEMKMSPMMRKENRRKRMGIDKASGVTSGDKESVASIRDKIKKFQGQRIKSEISLSGVPDLPESSLHLNLRG